MKNTMKEKEGKSGMKRKKYTKIAMAFSLCLMALWFSLGIGATLAWFTDTTPTARNSFVIGELDLTVYYKNDLVEEFTKVVDKETAIFNDQALYEPGYTQVVYLQIENSGEVDFNYKLSVDTYDYTESINYYGMPLHLPKYLKYGVVFAGSEEELAAEIETRQLARIPATNEGITLNWYSEVDSVTVKAGESRYAAIVVFMPESVGNEANYLKGSRIPEVRFGMTVYAQQAGTQIQ